jgi:hypothetical protein
MSDKEQTRAEIRAEVITELANKFDSLDMGSDVAKAVAAWLRSCSRAAERGAVFWQ